MDQTDIDWEAYGRVWWAYHGYLDRIRGGDVKKIEPLWAFLETIIDRIAITAGGFRELGYNLIAAGKFRDGTDMLRIATVKLKYPPKGLRLIKSGIRSIASVMQLIRTRFAG